jgi:hypothetical protein
VLISLLIIFLASAELPIPQNRIEALSKDPKQHSIGRSAEDKGPNAILSISDIDGAISIGNSETYNGSFYPTTFIFSSASSTGPRPVINTDWDFGDGNKGFGYQIEYTYHKAGTYHVTMNVYDSQRFSSTATATIKIIPLPNCIDEEGDTICLSMINAHGNILPFSESIWTFGNVQNLSYGSPQGSWAKLSGTDPQENKTVEVDVSDIVTLQGGILTVPRDALLKKNINLKMSYILQVDTTSSSGTPMNGHSKRFYFGSASATFKFDEPNVRLEIYHINSKYKKYIDLGANLSITVNDLPSAMLFVNAQKESRSDSFEVDLSNATTQVVQIDISEKTLKERFEKKRKKH